MNLRKLRFCFFVVFCLMFNCLTQAATLEGLVTKIEDGARKILERKKWDMDYGPFLNLSIQMPGENPGGNG